MRLNAKAERADSVSQRVVERIADHKGVEATDLDLPLYAVVDPDALDALFAQAERDAPRPYGHVTFQYDGCEVTVESDGTVHLTDAPRRHR